MRVQPLALQHPVNDLGFGGGQNDSRVGGEDDLGPGHPHVLQLGKGMGVPQGDSIHAFLEHPGGPLSVGGVVNGADAAAVHEDLVAQALGG